MTDKEKTIMAFVQLGNFLTGEKAPPEAKCLLTALDEFEHAKQKAINNNPWFNNESIALSLNNIASMLDEHRLKSWANRYPDNHKLKNIGVVMAGNIPLVGFHDFLCVLIAGHRFVGKLSREDKLLLPALANILAAIEPALKEKMTFSESNLSNFDAIIATGSGNTSRYFEYYFGKYPNIIRQNRHGIAVLNGHEKTENLALLGQDIFSYFGLGCRNVSMLFVPEGYSFQHLLDTFEQYAGIANHAKYFNNYEYNKALFLINQEAHYDNGFVLLHENDRFGSAVSVLHYQYYRSAENLEKVIRQNSHLIQCIVSDQAHWPDSFCFGKAQSPALDDYADGIDTMAFLSDL